MSDWTFPRRSAKCSKRRKQCDKQQSSSRRECRIGTNCSVSHSVVQRSIHSSPATGFRQPCQPPQHKLHHAVQGPPRNASTKLEPVCSVVFWRVCEPLRAKLYFDVTCVVLLKHRRRACALGTCRILCSVHSHVLPRQSRHSVLEASLRAVPLLLRAWFACSRELPIIQIRYRLASDHEAHEAQFQKWLE